MARPTMLRHPETIAVFQSTLQIVLRDNMPLVPGERVTLVALLHIVRVELLDPRTSPSLN